MLRKLLFLVFAVGIVDLLVSTAIADNEKVILRFEEGSGLVASDISGNSNNATLYGGASWPNGMYGTGLGLYNPNVGIPGAGAFDFLNFNNNQFAVTPMTTSMGSANAITLECWFNADSVSPGALQALVTYGQFQQGWGPFGEVELRLISDSIDGAIRTNGSWDSVYYGPVTAGVWHHGAVTFSNADPTIRLFLDGVEVASRAKPGKTMHTVTSANVGVGVSGGFGCLFNGEIDDVVVTFAARKVVPQEILVKTVTSDVDATEELLSGVESIEAKLDDGLPDILDATDDILDDTEDLADGQDVLESKIDTLETKLDVIDQLLRTPQGRREGWNQQ